MGEVWVDRGSIQSAKKTLNNPALYIILVLYVMPIMSCSLVSSSVCNANNVMLFSVILPSLPFWREYCVYVHKFLKKEMK